MELRYEGPSQCGRDLWVKEKGSGLSPGAGAALPTLPSSGMKSKESKISECKSGLPGHSEGTPSMSEAMTCFSNKLLV